MDPLLDYLFGQPQTDQPAMRAALLRGQQMAQQPMFGQGQPMPAQMPANRAQMMQRQQQELAQASQAQEQAYQPIDRAPMEQAYQQRAQSGGMHLLTALAAQQAGPSFEPIQAHFLKQATAAQAPMKMAGGTMTEQGFIEDPSYRQDLGIKRADAKVANLERALQGNITADEGERLKKDLQKAQQEFQLQMAKQQQAFQQGIAGQASADRRYTADLAHQDRQAAAVKPDKGTEGERAAAGFLGRMDAAEKNLDAIGAAGRPNTLTKTLGYTGLGGATRAFLESEPQQLYRAAQEEWVRAKLRKESGAAIPTEEMDREIATNFPQPGERDAVVAQKRQTRAQAAESMKTMAAQIRSNEAAPVTAPAKAPPQVGEVRGGYTYKGGNPADPGSWSK
jgi:hypothetical protein